ncbi:MAG: ribosome recycling factor, partial [Rhodospirillaceae bacterium]|nr:ribosome recycling factor [Rhodospirillaceae bacterium]
GEITEDEHRRLSEVVQKKTDEHVKKIDEMLAQKEQEIMKV